MGISLRHHVLSLVAIFLMLLVGLLLGVGLTGEPRLVEQIDQLNTRFTDEVISLERTAKTHENFARETLPLLVKDRLRGERIVVVVTSRPRDNRALPEIVEALQAAGATVPYHVVCREAFDGQAALARRLADAIAGSDEDGLESLDERGLVRCRGDVPQARPTAFVVVGGAKEGEQPAAESIDRPLVEGLQAAEIGPIVGCEDSAPVSYMEAYRELGISTVDNVDLARGQMSLVMALAGRPGNYGDGPSAEKEFAPLE